MVRRLLWVVFVVGLLVALLPVWFPWGLKPLLNHYGLGFARYERMSYTRFALGGVTGRWHRARLEVKHVECGLPTAWLWRQFISRTNASPFVSIKEGDLTLSPEWEEVPASDTGSLHETLDESVRIGAILKRLLPGAELTNCAIHVAPHRVQLLDADWRGGKLNAVAQLPELRGAIELGAAIVGFSSLQLSARSAANDSSVRGEFSRTAEGWRWQGEANWLTNRAEISAHFPRDGWLPVQARFNGPKLSVPGRLIRLPGYDDVTAALSVNVFSNRFTLDASGRAEPSRHSTAKGFPAADFAVAAEGNADLVFIKKLDMESPGLKVELTRPVGVTWRGGLATNPAQFRVSAELAKLPGATLAGRIEGLVGMEPHGLEPPSAQFHFSATNVHAWGVGAENLQVEGSYASARLKLDEVAADFADGSKLAASGTIDFQTRHVVEGHLKFSGNLLKRILPGWNYDELAGSGEVRGPFTNLSHAGQAAIKGLHNDRLKALNANVKWNGHNLRWESLGVELTGGESVLAIEGAVDLSALKERKTSATLRKASFRRGNEELYTSQRPCAISFAASATNSESRAWTLDVAAFDWEGAGRKVAVDANLSWPARGRVTAALTNVALGDFADFLAADVADVSLAALEVSAHWSNGPVRSTISVVGNLTNRIAESFIVRGALATDESLSVNGFSVATEYTPTLSVTGTVPVKIVPGRAEGWLVWDESQAIALAGNWQKHESQHFSLPLASRGEIDLAKPELALRISGTLKEPTATLTAAAASITWVTPANGSLRPRLEDLHLRAEVQPNRIKLDAFGAKLDGQSIEATGEWPVSAAGWRALWTEGELPDWSQAHGRLQTEGAQMAAISRYLPQVLLPEGRLNAMLELKTGKQLGGTVVVTNAATRSLGRLAPLRDIAALVRFDRQRAVLERFQGQMGGQPIRGDGFVTNPTEGALDYQINLRGTNVPLARSLALLLRGDFDLRLRGGSHQPPVLAGAVSLHDGLYVQQASALVWSGPRRPQLFPPYFSVTNQPLADWKLNVGVTGDRFLRARTPVFTGLVSANLNLQGLLREPVLTGDFHVNSGRILFPFGTLNVNQGFASFSGNDPQGPDLQISASGRNYRYDVRLEAKGPANIAQITFSSTPPLTSEQVLLMLTAGELPQSDSAFSSTARAGRLATFLGKDLLSRFLGNDPAEERLIIRTGEGISQEGQLTYSVEYRLTDRWSLIGEYDEFNAFNADWKWKILTR